jgi:hypothetical protein
MKGSLEQTIIIFLGSKNQPKGANKQVILLVVIDISGIIIFAASSGHVGLFRSSVYGHPVVNNISNRFIYLILRDAFWNAQGKIMILSRFFFLRCLPDSGLYTNTSSTIE